MSECLFCRIVEGEIPAEVVRKTDHALAFRDIDPKAPTHILLIPREHIASLDAAGSGQSELLGHLLTLAADLARDEGIADSGYRVITNVGDEGGQSVHHLHLHLLGGRAMGWPPG